MMLCVSSRVWTHNVCRCKVSVPVDQECGASNDKHPGPLPSFSVCLDLLALLRCLECEKRKSQPLFAYVIVVDLSVIYS